MNSIVAASQLSGNKHKESLFFSKILAFAQAQALAISLLSAAVIYGGKKIIQC